MTSTYTSAVGFSYNELKYQQHSFPYQSQEQELQEAEEKYCYAQYDLQVANAVAEADYEDYYCEYQYQDECDQDEYMEEYDDEEPQQYQQDPSYDYRNDSLLSLVVGVQNYLTEQADQSSKCDSPLYNLQYKMYVYMRQRAIELGVQF
ncbi:ER membrane glycoprotein subunit of the GPI transamidase complex-like protein [Mucor velutinosus]|uniref:ER membrane glycoprotein subunit of the GPI transamidase complex-like protein n=1 Tax=Mucor velutinosus TaxID=708070 RepID=A0AAN7DFN6_9FUNG|nr:ER membrane glycoprotein subunit of the GPI transamidase complex-like protein [Mucor velutinosus]